ncbi:MAG: tetratricopeptide repeat protein, partial [Acidobacteriota bacterium]
MGEVFLAEDLASPGSEVALKVLQADALAEEGADLRVEFGNMTRLRHPNLVAVREFGILDGSGTPFLTMEHVAGGSLRDAPLPLPPEIVTDILTQVCRALDYIHARDILHHDLKPGNLLVAGTLGKGGVVKLADFGLASAAGRTASLARGTPVYMAPERFTSQRVDRRADLYSLGAVLFHLLVGRPPFDPGPGLLDRILSGPPPEVAPPGEGLARALHAVIQKLLSPRPGLRYPSASAVIEAMNRLAGLRLRLDADPGRSLVRHAPLTGRDAELDRVREWLAAGTGSGPPMLVIRGETGMGKTRLIEEARAEAQLAGFEVIELELAAGAPGPFGAWPEPLQRLVRRLHAGEAPDELEEVARDLAPLLTGESVSAAAPRRRRAAATAALLHLASARFPLLLIVEDLGAAGPTDLAVLRRLHREAPVRVLASLRDDEDIAAEVLRFLAARTDSSQAAEIALRPLEAGAQAAMVASILGMDSIPRALEQRVAASSGGNPLWIEESLRTLIEDEVLVRAPEGWRLDAPGRDPVGRAPDAMAMARRRIEGLPDTERALLELVAVGGGRVPLDLLADLCGGGQALLARLVERGILEIQQDPSGDGVAFRHAVLQRTAYELCPADRRRALHARFAARLEGDATTPHEALARHLVGAGDEARGLDLLEESAREALRLHAHERAIPLLEDALRIAPPTRRAGLEEALADAQEAVGANRRAMEALRRALQADPEPGIAARLLARLGKNASLAGDYEAAVKSIADAAARFRVLEDRVGEAEAQKALGIAWARQNEFDRAETCYRAALEIYRALEDRDGMASLRNNLGLLRSFRGDHAGAVRQLEKAIALRDATGDRRGRLGTLINLGFVRNRQHDHEGAAAVLEESVALAESLGDLQNLGNARMFLAESLRGQGRMDHACRQLEAALRVHQETGDDARQIDCHDRIGEIHRLLGDVATAAEHHRRALDLARESHDPVQEAFALASLGLDRLGLGEPDALEDLQTALESGRSRSPRAEVRALRGL